MRIAEKQGFALVTVLLLMGFLVSLILGISCLLRMDFQLQSKILNIKKEKANALIGLRVALGELQETLGPDRYITASVADKDGKTAIFDAKNGAFMRFLEDGRSDESRGFYGYSIEDLGLSVNFKDTLGVLSNPGRSCLRKDLSVYLSTGKTITVNARIFEDERIKEDSDYIPKWEYVKSFYDLARSYRPLEKSVKPQGMPYDTTNQGIKAVFFPEIFSKAFGLVGKSTTPQVHAIGPVIVGCSFGFAPEFAKDDGSQNVQNVVNMRYFVTVALWNPYDFHLESSDYVFNIKPEAGGGKIVIGNRDYGPFKFSGAIKDGFKPGEVKLFSLYSEDTHRLLEGELESLGAIIKSDGKGISGSDSSKDRKRTGGFVFDNKRTVVWKKPVFSLELLSGTKKELYQVVYRLGLSKDENEVLDHDDYGVKQKPLFAIIFKNAGVSQADLMHYNPRAPVVDGTQSMHHPYEFTLGTSNSNVWRLSRKDFPDSKYGSVFSMPDKFESLGFLRHVNFGALAQHSGFVFGNSVRHSKIPRNLIRDEDERYYFYDYSYQLNENLWDSYFLSGKWDDRESVFEKNFLELSDSSGLLLKEAFNVNSISVAAWTELLAMLSELNRSDAEKLALSIVEQVKRRGPFLSLGGFVNRRLEDSIFGDNGVIQAALNDTGIALTQGEVLEAIGHKLTVRSDTFVIRAYGEVPIGSGSSRDLRERSCCEAVVQRVPEYLNPKENSAEDAYDELSPVNARFGRRFRIVSFRWAGGE